MITGIVTDDRRIVIPLEVIATDQPPIFLEAVVDTGFNGFLTLPTDTLNTSRALPVGTRRAELGDGQLVRVDVHLVKVMCRMGLSLLTLTPVGNPNAALVRRSVDRQCWVNTGSAE